MSNLDEQKVKALLKRVVRDIEDHYVQHTFSIRIEDILKRIDEADILTDQHACATVKHAKTGDDVREEQRLPKKDDNFYQ